MVFLDSLGTFTAIMLLSMASTLPSSPCCRRRTHRWSYVIIGLSRWCIVCPSWHLKFWQTGCKAESRIWYTPCNLGSWGDAQLLRILLWLLKWSRLPTRGRCRSSLWSFIFRKLLILWVGTAFLRFWRLEVFHKDGCSGFLRSFQPAVPGC